MAGGPLGGGGKVWERFFLGWAGGGGAQAGTFGTNCGWRPPLGEWQRYLASWDLNSCPPPPVGLMEHFAIDGLQCHTPDDSV